MRVLVATGGAAHSELAVRLAAEIAVLFGAKLTALTVVKHKEDEEDGKKILSRASDLLKKVTSEVKTKIRVGSPAEEIVAEINQGKYNLVIMGERATHSLLTRLIGPTAQHVIEESPCPVLIAKQKIGPLHRILLCDSGAQTPTLLQRFATRLPKLLTAESQVTVLHVMSQITAYPGVPGTQLRAEAEELIQAHTPEGEILEQDIQVLERLGIHPLAKVRHGLVVDEILDEAQGGDYDLIVIGAHRYEGWPSILLDDLARQIVWKADRPILVVH